MGGCTCLIGQQGCIDSELGSKLDLEDDTEKCDVMRDLRSEVVVRVLPRSVQYSK